jgi:hypothetical protein
VNNRKIKTMDTTLQTLQNKTSLLMLLGITLYINANSYGLISIGFIEKKKPPEVIAKGYI